MPGSATGERMGPAGRFGACAGSRNVASQPDTLRGSQRRRAPGKTARKGPLPDTPVLGLSVGVAIADPRYPEQLQQLIKRADEVMYQVKRRGKGSMLLSEGPLDADAALKGQG